MVEFGLPTAWYWYMSIGLAAVCLGIPIFLIYWVDKKKKKSKNLAKLRGQKKLDN